jgi:hypothetical protein
VQEQVAKARAILAREHPELEQGADIGMMGVLGRTARPGAQALTNPLTGSISISEPLNEGNSEQQMADTLLHELTHRKQVLAQSPWQRVKGLLQDVLPGGEPYHRRPDELEAFEAEIRRAISQGRTTYTPSFATGAMTEQADIPLRRQAMITQLKRK